jgi:hypothetical protein
MGQSAFAHLNPLAIGFDVDLASVSRVWVQASDLAMTWTGSKGCHNPTDHVVQVIDGEAFSLPHPPQIELVRGSRMQAINRISPVYDPSANH